MKRSRERKRRCRLLGCCTFTLLHFGERMGKLGCNINYSEIFLRLKRFSQMSRKRRLRYSQGFLIQEIQQNTQNKQQGQRSRVVPLLAMKFYIAFTTDFSVSENQNILWVGCQKHIFYFIAHTSLEKRASFHFYVIEYVIKGSSE